MSAAVAGESGAKYAAGRCALVVVDMQNDFCAEDGYIAKLLGRDMAVFRSVAAGVEQALAAARAAGVPVVWLAARYEDDLVTAAMLRHKRERAIAATCCVRGTWGYDWFGVRPAAGEPAFEKHCFSGFGNPAFAAALDGLGVDTLLFTGVQTNVCVESTLRDAHTRGFHVALVEQAVGSHSPELHAATLANVRFLFGEVLDLGSLPSLWPARAAG